MAMQINHNDPTIMHIDLNSCFATIEQQADPLLRGKPIVVAAYTTPNGCVVAPSIEAKKLGIKVGMRVRDARLLCSDVVVLPPDPPKYRDVHLKLKNLFKEYSPSVVPKSIDEAVIDFRGTPAYRRGLVDIGKEIKLRIRDEIGSWLSCNVGISTNRFLAKLAASLHKPDGLDFINHTNLIDVYGCVSLTDLNGINTRYQARLNTAGIFTPVDFLNASEFTLKKVVFQSVVGYYWFLRIRGWEIDEVDFSRRSFGQTYSLGKRTDDPYELGKIIMKLSEKLGRRMRNKGYEAYGIHTALLYVDGTHWHTGRKVSQPLYATSQIFNKAMWLYNQQPVRKAVSNIAVSCFSLKPHCSEQLSLFDTYEQKLSRVTDAADVINNKYGEFIITPALMAGMNDLVIDRISFGGVKELQDLYELPIT